VTHSLRVRFNTKYLWIGLDCFGKIGPMSKNGMSVITI